MINEILVYISDSLDVYENLAIEKHLFDSVSEDCCILYLWQNKSAIVIGTNQNPHAECNMRLVREENISIARRLSGGGAVFHDLGNLNFTFLSHQDNYDIEKNMHIIQTACHMAGIKTQISGRNDILASEKKFSGNAFYHSGEKAYHHGTIMICADIIKMGNLLTPSKAKLRSKGIKSVKSRVINLCDLSCGLNCETMKSYMIEAFEKAYDLKVSFIKEINSDIVYSLAKEYSSWEYIYGKTASYTFSNEGYFTWGNIEISLRIENEYITEVNIFTDAINRELPQIIKESICGCKFRNNDIALRLFSVLEKEIAENILSLLF